MDNSNGGGGEVTRVNIVYFLSREGKVEHPHLIRVHHHHRGIRLQDVKRWLSDLRGKEMPDHFAWSYKRRYKTGYVWQDLKNEDLITSISDNEYVLKGSWIPCTPSAATNIDSLSSEEKSLNIRGEETPVTIRHKPSAEAFRFAQPDDDIIISPPPELDKDSSDERTAVFKIDMHRHVKQVQVQAQAQRRQEKVGGGTTSAGRASHVFRNILTCGLVETDDSALRPVDRRDRARFAAGSAPLVPVHMRTKSTSKGKSTAKAGEKAVPAIYKPTSTPICSQCAKNFRPEKMHSHMKSCKALKGRSNGVDVKRMSTKTESCNQEFSKATKSSLLTH